MVGKYNVQVIGHTTRWWTLNVLASWPSALDKTKRFSWLVFCFCLGKAHTHKKEEKGTRIPNCKLENVAISLSFPKITFQREFFFAQPCNLSLFVWFKKGTERSRAQTCCLSRARKSIICVVVPLLLLFPCVHIIDVFCFFCCCFLFVSFYRVRRTKWFKVRSQLSRSLPVTCIPNRRMAPVLNFVWIRRRPSLLRE
jgi:hypothetical protein